MTKTLHSIRSLGVIAAAAAMLAACGGGGGDGGGFDAGNTASSTSISLQAPSSAVNTAGSTVEVMGTAKSSNSVITSLEWTSSPAATLTNADCAASVRNSQIYTANPSNSTGSTTWSCAVGIDAPANLSASGAYTLTLTAKDDKGNIRSASQVVNFTPSPTPPIAGGGGLTANAGNSFNALPGSVNSLHCDASGGEGPYSYAWVITNNAGYNFALSNYNSQDSTFTAPPVRETTLLTFSCRATDAANKTSVSTVSATVTPPAGSVVTNSLVANVAQPGVATPGQTLALDGSATGWFSPSGQPAAGGAVTYEWTSNDANVVISNPASSKTTVTFPGTYTVAKTVQFTLKASSGTSASSSTVNVLVDPYGPLSLTLNPSSTATKGNLAVSIQAQATTSASAPELYYQWTQISGPALDLGGASTSTLGVVPPTAAANTVYVFRVAVGYAPITPDYPGLYFSEATVTVTP